MNCRRNLDNLRVDSRIGLADHFKTKLVKLAKASFLRAVVPEKRLEIIKFHRLRELIHPVLNECADDPRGALRSERELVATFFRRKRVQFFFDDVGLFADSASE